MPTRSAEAVWKGKIGSGSGQFETGSGVVSGSYSVPTRFGDEAGTNPEELVAAAHAACYAMQLSALITGAGYEPTALTANAHVTVEKQDEGGWKITGIKIECTGDVPGIEEDEFLKHANEAKESCPISTALSPPITLEASLA